MVDEGEPGVADDSFLPAACELIGRLRSLSCLESVCRVRGSTACPPVNKHC